MSLPVQGFQSMLKGGTKNLQGLEEAVYMNIRACKELSQIARTSMGPHGLFKMIVNHLEKLIVTKNAVQMTSELEVRHPAGKMLVLAAANQALEFGDGTNLVITLAGELLNQAENLLKQGIVVQDIVAGYEKAFRVVEEHISNLRVTSSAPKTAAELEAMIRSAVAAKQYGNEELIAGLVAEAVMQIARDGVFNADFVRVAKVPGGALGDSHVVRGMVIPVVPKGIVQKVQDAKIAVFSCPIELRETETKGTILLEAAEDLRGLNAGEEAQYEELIKSYADAGINVLVSQLNIHELALHYCNKYGIMHVKISSKYETRRFATSVGAEIINICRKATKDTPTGHCDSMRVQELGEKKVLVCQDLRPGARDVSTIVLRAATDSLLNDAALAVGSGVNVAKAALDGSAFLPGAGAAETALSMKVRSVAGQETGLEQYSMYAYAEALLIVPRVLAETAGQSADHVVSCLTAAHAGHKANTGVNVEAAGQSDCTLDAAEEKILDAEAVKLWALRSATDAACSVLRVDQVIMRKQAGGPKQQEQGQAAWN